MLEFVVMEGNSKGKKDIQQLKRNLHAHANACPSLSLHGTAI